ncbi:MAG: carbon-nitrogen hydrolase family protein [bacterium]|nr:carbon-nitrogen hydrolase family protein [bacterium]
MNTRIALGQISASDDIDVNIQKGEAFVKEAVDKGVKIICFPELCFTKFFPQYPLDTHYYELAETIPGPTTERFQKLAQANEIVIIINLYEKAEDGKYFDSSPVIGADGKLLGKVQMNHIAQEPLFYEKDYYHPGTTGNPVFETPFGNIAVAICYDRHFSEQMRALTLDGAEIIFIPQAGIKTNPIKGYELEMQGTSFTNQIYIALVNRTGAEDQMEFAGGSFVTDPSGEFISHAGEESEEMLIVDCDLDLVSKLREDRPFLRDRRPELYGRLINE